MSPPARGRGAVDGRGGGGQNASGTTGDATAADPFSEKTTTTEYELNTEGHYDAILKEGSRFAAGPAVDKEARRLIGVLMAAVRTLRAEQTTPTQQTDENRNIFEAIRDLKKDIATIAKIR